MEKSLVMLDEMVVMDEMILIEEQMEGEAEQEEIAGWSNRQGGHAPESATRDDEQQMRTGKLRAAAQCGSSGTWCSGITSASHAEGPGFNPQCVQLSCDDLA